MRKVLIAACMALTLSGCATTKWVSDVESVIRTVTGLGNASIANPVTRARLYQMENAVIIVFAGLDTWYDACQSGTVPPSCFEQIAAVQAYTQQIPPYLQNLRGFVRSNRQIDAQGVWNQILNIITIVKNEAGRNGIDINVDPGVRLQ